MSTLKEELDILRNEYNQLETKYNETREENIRFKEMGNFDLSYYNHQIKTLEEQIEDYVQQIKAEREHRNREQQERAAIDHDRVETERIENMPWQSPIASYKVMPHGMNKDIWNDSGRPVFDTGIDLENFTGIVYLPVVKIIEMARSIGMLTKEDSDKLIETYEKEKAKNEFAAIEAKELIRGISELVDRFDGNLAGFVVPPVVKDEVGLRALEESVESSGEESDNDGQDGVDNRSERATGVSDPSHDTKRGIFDLPDL